MKLTGRLKEGLQIFVNPAFIAVYFAYGILNAFFAEFFIPVHILAVIFLEPLLFSYFVSRYFVLSVDPAQRLVHARLPLRFYFPFVKIFGVLFVLSVFIQSAYFGFASQSAPKPVYLLCLFSMLSTVVVFWMVTTVFCGRGVWHGLKQVFSLARRNLAGYGAIFFIYSVFSILSERTGAGDWQKGGVLYFLAFHAVYSVFDLYMTRVTIGLANTSFDRGASLTVLDGYKPGAKRISVSLSDSEQMKKANVCLLLGVLSVIPVVHLFAALLGWKRYRQQEFGRFRAFVGCLLGTFFSLMYCISLLGILTFQKVEAPLAHIASLDEYSRAPGVSPELKQVIDRLKTSRRRESAALAHRLESMKGDDSAARYFALGVAQSYSNQPRQALEAFKKCIGSAGATPEALFHIGRLSLFNRFDYFEARNSLAKFLTYKPRDKTAQLYISLIDNRVGWDNNWIISILSVIALLTAMTTHEYGHSYAAYKCGDPTPKKAGRMSLNPIVHLDLFGSIVLPAFLILSRSSIIVGWAKPVPVDPANFKNSDRDRALVSSMGCLTNFTIALATTVLLVFVTVLLRVTVPDFMTIHWLYPSDFISVAGVPLAKFWIYCTIFLILMIMINIAIGIFNLIPIPPLDGSWIVERKLAPFLKEKYAAYQQFSFLLILILLFTNCIDLVISSCLNAYFFFIQIVTYSGFNIT